MAIVYRDSVPTDALFMQFVSPEGVTIDVAMTDPESSLAHRFGGLWSGGGLREAASVAVKEREQFEASQTTLCHQLAFEVAYGIVATAEELSGALRDWRWTVADTARGLHSWIEYRTEAIDFQMGQVDGAQTVQQLAFVRPLADLRSKYQPKNSETVSVLSFAKWLRRSTPSLLFSFHPNVARQAAANRSNIRLNAYWRQR